MLLTEDNLVNQRLAVRLLVKRGHRVAVAATGLEVLRTLVKESFALVLMDVPDAGDGRAAGHRGNPGKRENHRAPPGGGGVDGARDPKEIARSAWRVGWVGYLTKPIRP